MARKKYLNLHFKNAKQWQGVLLCPLATSPFDFDKKIVGSLEAFVHALKVPPTDQKRRGMMLMEGGVEAHKRFGRMPQPTIVRWNDDAMAYGDEQYERLLERVIRIRIRRDKKAQVALVASHGFELIHEREKRGHILSSIPAELYCGTLMAIREEIFKSGRVRMFV